MELSIVPEMIIQWEWRKVQESQHDNLKASALFYGFQRCWLPSGILVMMANALTLCKNMSTLPFT